MSPEKLNNEPLPEEPYHQHYDDLERSKQENEAKEEATESKTDTKKGFSAIKGLLATGTLALGLTAGGIAIHNEIQDENRFPDNYRPVPQEQTYVEASHSVIPGATTEEQKQLDEQRQSLEINPVEEAARIDAMQESHKVD
jgi:hypothetical protein